MASKKKEIRQAAKDGTITKQENRTLNAAGVTPDRLQNFQTRQETISNVGKKFGTGDFKALKDSGLSNNKILKVAAGTNKVNAKASNKLTGLNPGIKLPSRAAADMSGRLQGGSLTGFSRLYNGLDALGVRTELAKSLEGLGKKYLQWQGTDAKGRPQALGGFKVPKNLRKADQNNPLGISQKALKRGTFSAYDGSGTLFGRDGSSVLGGDGKMKNRPASWMPGKGGNGTGSGKKKGGKGEGEMGGMEAPSLGGGGDSSSSSTGGLSGVFGGTGTETYGSPTFRRRRSRAQRSGSFTQGPSRLGINLQRQSGLNIMRA
jgi:hypothetical protein